MVKEIGEALSRFAWLLGQAFFVSAPLLTGLIVGVTLALAFVAAWKFPKDAEARRRLPLLLILPACWLFLGLWGAWFYSDWLTAEVKHPEWVSWPIEYMLGVFAFIWIVLLIYLRGARIVALIFGMWNLYFMLVMTLLTGMSVSGNWI